MTTVDWKEIEMSSDKIHCQLKYSVSDTGRGITKEKKQELFKFLAVNDNIEGNKCSLTKT